MSINTSAGIISRQELFRRKKEPRAPSPSQYEASDDVVFLSATRLAELIRKKEISSQELVSAYIKRIEKVNYRLNAVVMDCFERALSEAKAADKQTSKSSMGPLHGVPMTIKDSLDTEGVISTGGTLGYLNRVPTADATVVARLRQAGAILLGKTNTPEFTLIGGVDGVNTTNNIIYGLSRNPYDLSRTTSGSSGGAGAIVAAGGAPFDVGTDWGGSVRGPSHANGIAGLKPTSVRLPRTGHIVDYGGLFDAWQQPGPMARYVEDLDLLTPIMAGPDFKDAVVIPMPWPDYRKVDLKGLKVAFFSENKIADTAEDVKQTVKKTVAWLEEAGAEVTEDLPRELLVELGTIRRDLIVGDGWSWLLRTVESKGSKAYGDSLEGRLEQGGSPISSAEYTRLLELQDKNRSAMLQWFSKYDLLICPVAPKAAGIINVGEKEGSYYMDNPGESYTKPFNTCGWPSAVVRCGTSEDKMPIGVQCVAHPWREDISLAAAAHLESRSGGWQKPNL